MIICIFIARFHKFFRIYQNFHEYYLCLYSNSLNSCIIAALYRLSLHFLSFSYINFLTCHCFTGFFIPPLLNLISSYLFSIFVISLSEFVCHNNFLCDCSNFLCLGEVSLCLGFIFDTLTEFISSFSTIFLIIGPIA